MIVRCQGLLWIGREVANGSIGGDARLSEKNRPTRARSLSHRRLNKQDLARLIVALYLNAVVLNDGGKVLEID
jgi:hypothetical protein